MSDQAEKKQVVLTGGAAVTAIIPTDFDQVWKFARYALVGGFVPASLTNKKNGDEATAAAAIAIMSGAELGLKPLMALRSIAVINGRPALYGDGIMAVVRQSGIAKDIKRGTKLVDGKHVGFCTATRKDTGETLTVEFTQDEATRAGLWDDRPEVDNMVWGEQRGQKVKQGTKKNDSPWYRYGPRMLMWRATHWCLRDLFADVLAGVMDETEATEVIANSEPAIVEQQAQLSPPSPPAEEPEEAEVEETATEAQGAAQAETRPDGPPSPPDEADEPAGLDYGLIFSAFESALAEAKDEGDVEQAWADADFEQLFADDEDSMATAMDMKLRRLLAFHPANAG